MNKREGCLSWDDYFMNVASLSAQRSKDPSCQVGCCIVNEDNIICATGYNGMPKGISDNDIPWGKNNENELDNKYKYVIHAEVNAILNKNSQNLKNCILYCTHSPCNECTKIIIQSDIKKIYYLNYKKDLASERMLSLTNIPCIKLKINQQIYIKKNN